MPLSSSPLTTESALQVPPRPQLPRPSLRTVIRSVVSWHAPLAWFAASMGLIALVAAVGLLIDDRVLVGAPIWAKALKFAISFGVYALTFGWMIDQVRRPRVRRIAWWAGTALAAASLLEMVVIVGQIIRGTRSHFNNETPFDATMFAAMGGFVAVIYLASLIVAGIIAFTPFTDRVLSWSLRLGGVISVMGLSTGFLMLLPTAEQAALGDASLSRGAHGVGVVDGGPSIPILGWSTTGGDIRISHFVGMHALQLLPLLAIVLTGFLAVRLSERTRLQLVFLAGGVYLAVFALALWQALRGQSVIAPDSATVAAAVTIVIALIAGVIAIRLDARATSPARTLSAELADVVA
jgi:hypothetical protein